MTNKEIETAEKIAGILTNGEFKNEEESVTALARFFITDKTYSREVLSYAVTLIKQHYRGKND